MISFEEEQRAYHRVRPSAGWAAAALLLGFVLGGCGLLGGESVPDRAATRAAETITARAGQEETGPTPTLPNGKPPTATAPPTDTVQPTASPAPTETARPTAASTPALEISVSFERLTGFDSLFLEFAVTNQGGAALESASVTVTDPGSGTAFPPRERDGFGRVGGEGGGGSEIAALDPGQSGWAYSGFFASGELPASGQPLEVEIQACTADGLAGRCAVETLTVTRP